VCFSRILLSSLLIFISFFLSAAPTDFSGAKRLALRIYADEPTDFYCDCPITWRAGKGDVDLNSCGYQIRKNGPRAKRVEWEHVMPAQQFGAARACWQQGGRENCGDSDQKFRLMEADLFNLRPALGEVNGDRAHFRFAELPQTAAQHGQCPIRIDFSRQLAQPRPEIRGDIARVYFYMADRYQLALSRQEEQLFLHWHDVDPVDDRELELMLRTAQHMGHRNEFVTGVKRWYLGYLSQQPSTEPATVQSTAALHAPDHTSPVRGNQNSKKYHYPHCSGYKQINSANQREFVSGAAAEAAGYRLAGNCKQQP
jgi:deoxyribonuclease-1